MIFGVSFIAYGMPATQGSARAFMRGGRPVVVHDGGSRSKLASWRSVVTGAAVEAMQGREPFDGPIRVSATFVLPRPKSAPKWRLNPDRKPDLDKLARAIGDALEGVVYTQDSRVCQWELMKVYGPRPGVEVTVGEISGMVEF